MLGRNPPAETAFPLPFLASAALTPREGEQIPSVGRDPVADLLRRGPDPAAGLAAAGRAKKGVD